MRQNVSHTEPSKATLAEPESHGTADAPATQHAPFTPLHPGPPHQGATESQAGLTAADGSDPALFTEPDSEGVDAPPKIA